MGRVTLLSFGCPKNQVDSENLLKKLRKEGFSLSSNVEESDIILINTCGFIEAAKKESIDGILNLAREGKNNKDKKLIVFGCLAGRYPGELKKEIPEIDALWGVGGEDEIVEYCRKQVPSPGPECIDEKFHDNPYAYLKIADGCDRSCSYCVIPGIRGKFRSREPERIFNEAEELIKSGIKELILVAQDSASYGKETGGYNLGRLVRDIASISGDFRVRLLYLHPFSIDDRLLETIGAEVKVCNYIDMPLQHSEEKILRLMGRGGKREYFEKLISRIRDIIPEVSIRTTFIAGFPQETDRDFNELVRFIRKVKFERLGVFTYSREEGTPAYKIKGQISGRTKKERYNKIMEVQASISLENNRRLTGRTFRALIDDVDEQVTIARLDSQAPDIDGVVMLEGGGMKKGDFVNLKITDIYDYDLKGIVID